MPSENENGLKVDADADAKAREKRERLIVGGAVFIGLVLLIAMNIRESGKYPELSAFGIKDWSVKCANSERQYHLLSTNPTSHQSRRSITDRSLKFLDERGKKVNVTYNFDQDALGAAGVWRFHYNHDRLFAKKDQSLLQGDEATFAIDENFQWLKVTLQTGETLSLDCQRLAAK